MLNSIYVVGTGSTGNAYIINWGQITFMIEAGMILSEVKKYVPLSNISFCLVSHKHDDHAKYISSYIKAGIQVWGSRETGGSNPNVWHMREGIDLNIKGFRITPIRVEHSDLEEHFAFFIENIKDGERLFFITDIGYIPKGIEKYLDAANVIMLEANWDRRLIFKTPERIMVDYRSYTNGHLAIDKAFELIENTSNWRDKSWLLIHKSFVNSDINSFKRINDLRAYNSIDIAANGLCFKYHSRLEVDDEKTLSVSRASLK